MKARAVERNIPVKPRTLSTPYALLPIVTTSTHDPGRTEINKVQFSAPSLMLYQKLGKIISNLGSTRDFPVSLGNDYNLIEIRVYIQIELL